MPKNLEYEGICACCKNAIHCVFLKDADCPIIQCEEFERFPPIIRKSVDLGNPKHVGACSATIPQKMDTIKYKGLCVNCMNLESCTFPKPEGGVWRCEEYE